MKTTLVRQFSIRLLVTIAITCTFSSCAKQKVDCEVWEVTYNSVITGTIGSCGINLSCGSSRTVQEVFCGDNLKDAQAGNTITSKDQCCTNTMTFNRFIKRN